MGVWGWRGGDCVRIFGFAGLRGRAGVDVCKRRRSDDVFYVAFIVCLLQVGDCGYLSKQFLKCGKRDAG